MILDPGHRVAAAHDWHTFHQLFIANFYDPGEKKTAAHRLCHLIQTRSVLDYTSEFKEIKSIFEWMDDGMLQDMYYQGLKEGVKDMLMLWPDPTNLTSLINNTLEADVRIMRRVQERCENDTYPTTRPPQTYPQCQAFVLYLRPLQQQCPVFRPPPGPPPQWR